MKNIFVIILIALGLSGCFRQAIEEADYSVPEMKKPEAAHYLTGKIKQLPGINEVACDIEKHIITVTYNSDISRFMNIEEAIAYAGFSVNNRPANPAAKAQLAKELLENE